VAHPATTPIYCVLRAGVQRIKLNDVACATAVRKTHDGARPCTIQYELYYSWNLLTPSPLQSPGLPLSSFLFPIIQSKGMQAKSQRGGW